MALFQQRYAEKSHIRFSLVDGASLAREALIISANIPLREGSPGYDQAKVDELAIAAADHAGRHGYQIVEFLSVSQCLKDQPDKAPSRCCQRCGPCHARAYG